MVAVLDPAEITGVERGYFVHSSEDGRQYLVTADGAIPADGLRELTVLDDAQLSRMGSDWFRAYSDGSGRIAIDAPASPIVVGNNAFEGEMSGVFVGSAQKAYLATGVGFGAVTPQLELDFTAGALDPRVTFTRSSTATYFDADGVLQTAAANAPRFNHDPATGEPLGLLIEPSRTNLLTYSEQFDNAIWTKSNVTITPNAATAPDGTTTADLITITNAANPYVYRFTVAVTENTTYTMSYYVKLGTLAASDFRLAVYNATAGNFIAADVVPSVTPTTTGWVRVVYTFTTPAGCTDVRVYPFRYNPSSLGTFYLWGAQLEAGANATSYIKTEGSTVTRAADVASIPDFADWYNQSEGTWFAEFDAQATGFNRIIGYNSGLSPLYSHSSGLHVITNNGSVGIASPASTPLSAGAKAASAYNASGRSISLNGNIATGSGAFSATSSIYLGGPSSAALNGHLRRIAYWPRRLSDAHLQALTA